MSNEKVNITLSGLECSHCEFSIKKALSILKGVNSVNINSDNKTVEVEYDPQITAVKEIKDTIEYNGYSIVD